MPTAHASACFKSLVCMVRHSMTRNAITPSMLKFVFIFIFHNKFTSFFIFRLLHYHITCELLTILWVMSEASMIQLHFWTHAYIEIPNTTLVGMNGSGQIQHTRLKSGVSHPSSGHLMEHLQESKSTSIISCHWFFPSSQYQYMLKLTRIY